MVGYLLEPDLTFLKSKFGDQKHQKNTHFLTLGKSSNNKKPLGGHWLFACSSKEEVASDLLTPQKQSAIDPST
jgi:hypothetical protein